MSARPEESVLHHYRVEKALADRLRTAGKDERRHLYAEVYNELFERVPDHTQNLRKQAGDASDTDVLNQFALTHLLLETGTRYLEIGPGDCAHALLVADRVAHVYAIDVSDAIASRDDLPANFTLILSDGTSVPVPAESVDVAYSNQLMEHLHIDDAEEQLRQIRNALRPGGRYLCITPNALCGPHDISRGFDDEPTGLHLKEYSIAEFAALVRKVGFSDLKCMVSYKRAVVSWPLPIWPFLGIERMLGLLPRAARRRLATTLLAVKYLAVR